MTPTVAALVGWFSATAVWWVGFYVHRHLEPTNAPEKVATEPSVEDLRARVSAANKGARRLAKEKARLEVDLAVKTAKLENARKAMVSFWTSYLAEARAHRAATKRVDELRASLRRNERLGP